MCASTFLPILHLTLPRGIREVPASLHPSQHEAAIQMLLYKYLAAVLAEVRSFTRRSALVRSGGIGRWGEQAQLRGFGCCVVCLLFRT